MGIQKKEFKSRYKKQSYSAKNFLDFRQVEDENKNLKFEEIKNSNGVIQNKVFYYYHHCGALAMILVTLGNGAKSSYRRFNTKGETVAEAVYDENESVQLLHKYYYKKCIRKLRLSKHICLKYGKTLWYYTYRYDFFARRIERKIFQQIDVMDWKWICKYNSLNLIVEIDLYDSESRLLETYQFSYNEFRQIEYITRVFHQPEFKIMSMSKIYFSEKGKIERRANRNFLD